MKTLSIVAALVLMTGCIPLGLAADATPKTLQKKLAEKFPDIKIESVNPSVLPGLFEVVTSSEIVYVDVKGEHLVIGQIIDTTSNKNLTETRWNELNMIDFNSLPFDQAIKIVKGDGTRKLAVFADPFCPYCKELEQNMQSIDNVTVYVFLYPLESIHPGSSEAAQDIWCANDRASAWTNWMVSQKAPDSSDCKETPIEALAKLGKQLKLNSTPTMFLKDGSRIPGSMDADKLEQRLKANK